ncbi:hypothetical protein [Burkholderia sp. AU6039]|uniref:hypothetical protein n=1 Tax=Burkholderia sp. AU6039 TaxID=2015344 RepID=UPI00117CD84E|nr:hypothetical protein [Burkholderia sp. AU6039]
MEAPTSELSKLAFEFFYRFSRFEFALKENGYLQNENEGAKALPGWGRLIGRYHAEFQFSEAAAQLLTASPKEQYVGHGKQLVWKKIAIEPNTPQLAQVVRLLQVVRNNLFHGGKHADRDWANPDRTMLLLESCLTVLWELAELAGITHDFEGFY